MKYIAYYDVADNAVQRRKYFLAATNKIDYICKVLIGLENDVEIISVAETQNNKFYLGKTIKLYNNFSYKLFPTIPARNKVFRLLGRWFMQTCLSLYLVFHTKKNEEMIVYHSVGYGNAIHLAKRIKKFKVILEVEEIYQDVSSLGKKKDKREYRDFEDADKYIFPTEMLNDKINKTNKPYAIIHGTYQVEPDRGERFDDDKIHVVYAGTFDPRKGGAAAAAAVRLPSNYHLHILGFGNKEDTENLKKIIEETNAKAEATVTYDGLLSGEDYIKFIQKCHIGLSTQNPDADFNATSFPSKILSYMANGLRVVSIRIPAIETSDIGEDMYYYDNQTPEEIAKAIMSVDLNDEYDSRKKIEQLDEKFKKNLLDMLNV